MTLPSLCIRNRFDRSHDGLTIGSHAAVHRRLNRLLALPLLLVAAALLYGCGGGSGSGSQSSPTGATLSDQQRLAVLSDISTHVSTLLGPQPGMGNQAVLDYLKTRSELMNVGSSPDLSLHAQFQDGKVLIIANNRAPSTAGAARAASIPPTREAILLPTSMQFRVLNAMGSAFPASGSATKAIRQALTGANYQAASLSGGDPAGVHGLQQVSGDGVFVFSTHGGLGDYILAPGYFPALRTTTRVNLVDEVALRSTKDLDGTAPPVCYMLALDDKGPFNLNLYNFNYAITPTFAQKYWSFTPNSFVYLGACSSDVLGFKEVCIAKGAGEVAGWTNTVTDQSDADAAQVLFARLLGDKPATPLPPEPADDQRPYNLAVVSSYLAATVDPATLLPYNQSESLDASTKTKYTATLVFTYESGNVSGKLNSFGILNPSIASAKYEDHTIFLYGDFGDATQPHTVMLGSKDVTNQCSFGPISIVIPNIPVSGAGSSGDISVTVGNQKSNVVRLTEWRGDFTVKTNGENGLVTTSVFTAHFRALLTPLNDTLYGSPTLAGIPIAKITSITLSTEPDSYCAFSASGSQTSDKQRIQYSTNGTGMVATGNGTSDRPTVLGIGGTFDPNATSPRLEIYLSVRDFSGIIQSTTDLTTNKTTTTTIAMLVTIDTGSDQGAKLDALYNIVGGQVTIGNSTVSWPTISAISPPDPNAARAVRRNVGRRHP